MSLHLHPPPLLPIDTKHAVECWYCVVGGGNSTSDDSSSCGHGNGNGNGNGNDNGSDGAIWFMIMKD